MKLGLVTYNLAADWDCDAIIENCKAARFEGVEPRTTHKHGIEPSLSKDERDTVKKKFADAGIALVGLGSAWEYDSPDPAVLQQNIDGTKEFVKLAADLGIPGVKVRPNHLHIADGVPAEKTLEQIGKAGAECGAFAADYGVQIRMEVHGRETCKIEHMKTIMDAGDHPNFRVCWNCNDGETIGGSIKPNFDLLKDKIELVHIQDIGDPRYPWYELFYLLRHDINYTGYCLAEIQAIDQPVRLMHYYRALWDAYMHMVNRGVESVTA